MPYLGRTSFLPAELEKVLDVEGLGVNALSRAHFISTPTPKIA